MISITKIFRFEMAHAISAYDGPCKDVHGHSYVLHVSVRKTGTQHPYFDPPGFILDFKQLKKIVRDAVLDKLDHKLVLSASYLRQFPGFSNAANLFVWKAEPSAENILKFIKERLGPALPDGIELKKLQLYETADSFAEWSDSLF